MATLLIDIETVGCNWGSFSPATQQSLLKQSGEGTVVGNDEAFRIEKVQKGLGLSPYTGKIVALSMYDLERDLGAVYFTAAASGDSFGSKSFTFKERTEAELIEDFWDGARSYDTFVSFNGRAFAVPFLLARSTACRIKPTIEFPRSRQLMGQTMPYHIDLLDEFSFYGAVRLPSLQNLADTLRVRYEPPVRGEEVAEFYAAGKFRQIAEKSAADILAIKDLYALWKQQLAPTAFINATEM